MAVQTPVYQPSASQEASAAVHLDRRSDWRTYRVDGIRYVALPSGRSNHVYRVRADAAGCDCRWYLSGGAVCSHMIAVRRSAIIDQLVEAATAPTTRYESLVPACNEPGCQEPREPGYRFCFPHATVEVF